MVVDPQSQQPPSSDPLVTPAPAATVVPVVPIPPPAPASRPASKPKSWRDSLSWRVFIWSAMAATVGWTIIYQSAQRHGDLPEFVYVNF